MQRESFEIEQGRVVSFCGYESSVEVPQGVTEIGERAFWGARLMRQLVLPSSLRVIAPWAFAGCTALHVVDFAGGGVETIGAHAFFTCSSLAEVRLPMSLRWLGNAAFDGCTSLQLITIPTHLAEMGEGAFRGCRALRSVRVSSKNRVLYDREGVLFDSAGSLIRYPPGRDAFAYTVPEGVLRIAPGAFSDATMLREIGLPGSLREVGQGAFYHAAHLRALRLPPGVSSVGAEAFGACSSLTSVHLPPALAEISPLSFFGCTALTDIVLPPTVTCIGEGAFFGCRALRRIMAGRLSHVCRDAFSGCETLASAEMVELPRVVEAGNGALLAVMKKSSAGG